MQKNLQSLQNEINESDNKLNELKINSARHETRLEDLEIEIRNNCENLKDVKNKKPNAALDEQVALEKSIPLKSKLSKSAA